MTKNEGYVATYAEYAMEQMMRYGIPASVTLAQGILESSNGQSELSVKGNAHFGIKCTDNWLKNGGSYLTYTDDRPNEKFCTYATVGDSYEHHSSFLKENLRYRDCFRFRRMIIVAGVSDCKTPDMRQVIITQNICSRLLRKTVWQNMTRR